MKKIILSLACIMMLASCQQKSQQLSEDEMKEQLKQELRDEIEREYAEKELEDTKRELEQTKQELADVKNRQDNKMGVVPASSVAPLHKRGNASYAGTNPYAWLSQRKVCAADLRGLSGSELRIMRNAIYARHGYIFQSADLSRFFSQFSWYEPRYSNVESLLSSIEKHNVQEIRSWE